MPGRRTIAGANASVTTTVVVHQPSAPVVDQQASLKPATNGTSKHNTQSVPPLVSPPHPNGTGSSGAGFSGLTTPYLPLHSGPYCPIGVASPPSPLCYDIIEEEMIFPMSDITEEDEVDIHNFCACILSLLFIRFKIYSFIVYPPCPFGWRGSLDILKCQRLVF